MYGMNPVPFKCAETVCFKSTEAIDRFLELVIQAYCGMRSFETDEAAKKGARDLHRMEMLEG